MVWSGGSGQGEVRSARPGEVGHGSAGRDIKREGAGIIVYEWKIPKYDIPAQSAGEELERIERAHGAVTPRNLLEESRPGGAVLHGLFEWDDTAAAEKHRLWQAREIIGNIAVVRILDHTPREPVRAFVNIVQPDQARGYVSIVKVLSNEDYTRQMLEAALREFIVLREKYAALTELSELFSIIDGLQAKFHL